MTLESLQPSFVKIDGDGWRYVETVGDAQGIEFTCPACGTHRLLSWFRNRGVPSGMKPGPGRWDVRGHRYSELTLSPSVNVSCWHGFVRDGQVSGA